MVQEITSADIYETLDSAFDDIEKILRSGGEKPQKEFEDLMEILGKHIPPSSRFYTRGRVIDDYYISSGKSPFTGSPVYEIVRREGNKQRGYVIRQTKEGVAAWRTNSILYGSFFLGRRGKRII